MRLTSYALGRWLEPTGDGVAIPSAVTGETVAEAVSGGGAMGEVLDHARRVGGPALRRLTFHERADLIKRIATLLNERKDTLAELALATGATRKDSLIDVDGGIGTLFVYASKAKRELPALPFALDGAVETLSRAGGFVGRHILTPLQGVAVHINAYNFPCWGPLEKLAPAIIAGVPVVTKPATATAYVTHAMVRMIVEAGILPPGALQLVVGSTGDLFEHLTGQDVVSFTGSAQTAQGLQRHPVIAREAVRFIAERDSLNAAILGPEAGPETPEFDLFVREVVREMTVKAGQKCTAIRRVLVPRAHVSAVAGAVGKRLAAITLGDPAREDVRMGPLVGLRQRADVQAQLDLLLGEAEIVSGRREGFDVLGAEPGRGAFMAPLLLHCAEPGRAGAVHEVEAFGPVATLMPYDDLAEAASLVRRAEGSLVTTICTNDPEAAQTLVMELASFHGRLHLLDRDCGRESTGHGSPLPHLVHGGPGRAGGGEELGGVRGVHHYMQRTALQGSPARISAVTRSWIKGAPTPEGERHPFRCTYEELEIGRTFRSKERTVTLDDVEHFAHFTGDTFYAHMDEAATRDHPFFPGRVAHGYLLLAFAAGLFVDPDPGPVLANTGLDSLRFLKPVMPGEAIKVRLTVKEKTPRRPEYGEVRWDVEIANGADEPVAGYELLTMNAHVKAD